MSLSKGVGVFTCTSGSSMASAPNAADSGNSNHAHTCQQCDEDYDGTTVLVEGEDDDGRYRSACECPDECPSCEDSRNEKAYEAMLSDYYGGGGCQSDRERFDVDSMNRVRR